MILGANYINIITLYGFSNTGDGSWASLSDLNHRLKGETCNMQAGRYLDVYYKDELYHRFVQTGL
jgi:hypothetical protein